MTIHDFFRLMLRHWKLLVLLPLVMAASVFYFTSGQSEKYVSKTIIYTGIASGYKIDNSNGAGHQTTENAFGNLLTLITSRDTKEEVVLRLLAEHLVLLQNNPAALDEDRASRLTERFPNYLRAKIVTGTVEDTFQNLLALKKSNDGNELFYMLNSSDPNYSVKALESLGASRIGSSDLVQVELEANDPFICRQSLEILTEVFARKDKEIKAGQSESVISYFEAATQDAFKRLEAAEQSYLAFNTNNKIVDYSDQASRITGEKQQILERLHELELRFAVASANLQAIERKLAGNAEAGLNNRTLLNQRGRLAKLTAEIAELEMLNKTKREANTTARITKLKQEADYITNQMRLNVDKYFANTQSVEGIPASQYLDEWLRNAILKEESKAQLAVMTRRKENFEKEYEKMAPLGASLKKIQREIEMAEKEYMAMLDGLNQSRLTEQNNQYVSNVKVVDPPVLPSSPVGSTKRILLILFSAFSTFLLILGAVVGADLLDQKIKSPALAEKRLQLPVFGSLPALSAGKEGTAASYTQLGDQLARQLLLKAHQKDATNPYPFVVGVLSSLVGEGKTTTCKLLAERLLEMGIKTLVIYPEDHRQQNVSTGNTLFYTPLSGVAKGMVVADIAGKYVSDYDIVMIEFPAVLEAAYPVSLLKYLDMVLLTVNANRVWKEADKKIFAGIYKAAGVPIEVIVNKVLPEYNENLPQPGQTLDPKGGKRAEVAKSIKERREEPLLN